MASDTQTIPYDERLTDADLGKLVRLAIHTARENAGAPDAQPRISITIQAPDPT